MVKINETVMRKRLAYSSAGTHNVGMKTQYIDLHIHSTCSDGFLRPEEVVAATAECDLGVIALADHDNIDGIAPAMIAAEAVGITVIPGVELSSQWHQHRDMHLLGYGFDYTAPELRAELESFQEFRRNRSGLIVEKVNRKLKDEQREPLDVVQISDSADGTIGRPHIARALRAVGHVATNDEAFERYLVPCDVPKRYFPADQAIDLIHRFGGVAVLAHPPYLSRNRGQLRALMRELKKLGLDGVEAYNNGSGAEGINWLIKFAREHELIVTGGSDFHGDPGATIELGRGAHGNPVPYSCAEELCSALAARGTILSL
jgi:predicted metal-dependent phosphoesterase TrpH